jgi:hypothetical protein
MAPLGQRGLCCISTREYRQICKGVRIRFIPIFNTSCQLLTIGTGTLEEMLGWGYDELENKHDYIQILFPIPELSHIIPTAPRIDTQMLVAFKANETLRNSLRRSFERMLWFYGFKVEYPEPGLPAVKFSHLFGYSRLILGQFSKGDNYSDRASDSWNTRYDHNHKRISRIIRCLRLLGLPEEAEGFYNILIENNTRVFPDTVAIWKRATRRSLNIPPNVNRVADEEGMLLFVSWIVARVLSTFHKQVPYC